MDEIAVLLLNLGGPDSLRSIRPFLQNLFLDREIIQLPMQPILARVIAHSRAKKVKSRYEAIGGKSPILEQTTQQANALEKALNGHGGNRFKLYVGMRYWHPFIHDTMKEIVANNPKELVVLPLYPQYSRATTGSCFNEVKKSVAKLKPTFSIKYIDVWYDNPLYIQALSETVNEGLEKFGEEEKSTYILFSAHSLPQSFIEEGDPYLHQLEETVGAVMEVAGAFDHSLAFQSRSGPVKWMEPATDTEIIRLAKEGVKNLLVVPVSFVSDHIETLYEIDVMYKELALSNGINRFERTPSLNCRETFIKALESTIES